MAEYRPFESRQAVDRATVEGIRREREWAEKAEPVVITGVRIPFWTLVWWIAGITAGVSLVHAAFEWAFRLIVGIFASGDPGPPTY